MSEYRYDLYVYFDEEHTRLGGIIPMHDEEEVRVNEEHIRGFFEVAEYALAQ